MWTEDGAGRRWALVPPAGQLGDHTTLVRWNQSTSMNVSGIPLWSIIPTNGSSPSGTSNDGLARLVGETGTDWLGFSRDWGGSGTYDASIVNP